MIQSPQLYIPNQQCAYPMCACNPNNKEVDRQVSTIARFVQPKYSAVSIENYNPTVEAPQQYPQGYMAQPIMPYSQIPTNAYSGMIAQPNIAYPVVPNYPQEQVLNQIGGNQQPPVNVDQPNTQPPVIPPVPTVPEPQQPDSVINAVPVPAPQPQTIQQPTVIYEAPKDTVATEEQKPKDVQPQVQAEEETKIPEPIEQSLDLPTAVAALKSDDLEKQAKTMEDISMILENTPEQGTEFIDENVVKSLVDILNKDTANLEGPTPRQLALRQKLVGGEQLSPEEDAEAKQLSSMEAAERNKQYALFTLAMIQNALTNEAAKKGENIQLTDLPAINNMIEIATDNPNPMLRSSAIAGLSYIAKPEYKDVLGNIFEAAKNDADPTVKEVAEFALSKLNNPEQLAVAQEAQQSTQQPA